MSEPSSTSSPAVPPVPAQAGLARWVKWTLAAVLIASAVVRVPGLFYGFPEIVMRDERSYAGVALRMLEEGSLDPGDYRHGGSLIYYFYLSAFSAVYYPGHWLGFYPSVEAAPPWHFYLVARILSLLGSLASLVVLFHLGRKLFHARVGLGAAGLLALHPIFFRYGQLAKLDTFVVLFSLLAALVFLRLYEQGGRKAFWTAGLLVGAGVGVKYVLLALWPCLPAAFLLARRQVAAGVLAAPRVSGRLLAQALVLAVAMALLFNAFLLSKPGEARAQIERQYRITVEGQHLMAGTLPDLGPRTLLRRHLPALMGLPLALLGLAGWIARGPKNWPRWLLVTLHPAIHYALVCRSSFGFPRELLPIFPPLYMGAAWAIEWLNHWSRRREHGEIRVMPFLLIGLCFVSLLAPVRQTYEKQRRLVRGNTKVLAKRWAEVNLPTTAKIARDGSVLPMRDTHPQELFVYALGYHPYRYYVDQGVHYLMKGRLAAGVEKSRPEVAARDREIEQRGRRIASWDSEALGLSGPDLAVYRVVENASSSPGGPLEKP